MKHKKQNASCGNKHRNKTHADQIDDVAICSPLGPVLANIFLGDFEEKWLLNKARPSIWFRYVDHTFLVRH